MSLTRKVKINPSPLFRPTVNNKARKLTIVLTVSTNDADITPGVLGETLQKALETAGFGVVQLGVKESGDLSEVAVEDFIDSDEGRD